MFNLKQSALRRRLIQATAFTFCGLGALGVAQAHGNGQRAVPARQLVTADAVQRRLHAQ